jgi:xanthine dehydrogenase YagR molybdenum-binding subunit
VDADLGRVRVARMVGVFDVGRVLNAKTARSQLMGGMVGGIGMALHEATDLDERLGRVVNADLGEYHVPVQADVPEIDVSWIGTPDEHANPLGAKGIGELGITGTAAAIANAVFHATRRRVRDLPIRLDRLL